MTTGAQSRAGSGSDAVVVGAGHNGLVAAIRLADAGWDVTLLEGQDSPGGAVRSAELTRGYVTDLYSAFYPLAVASPAFAGLDLDPTACGGGMRRRSTVIHSPPTTPTRRWSRAIRRRRPPAWPRTTPATVGRGWSWWNGGR